MPIAVRDVVYLLDLDETPIKSLRSVSELEAQHVYDGMDIITLEVPISENVIVEQRLIYRGKQYIITEIQESRANRKVKITGESLFTELNHANIISFEITALPLKQAAERILAGTGWKLGEVDDDNRTYSLKEEGKSALYLLRQLVRLAEFQLEFDTFNRTIHIKRKIGRDLDVIFRYGKNVKDIKRNTFAPVATVLYPYGKGGLTIESVNNGLPYIEDYSWYESLGIPKTEAQKRFRKVHTWSDERFIYAGNLLKEAQIRLRQMAHPRISYETEVSVIGQEVRVGDYGYIVDEDLGIKVQVMVVRVVEYENRMNNKIEFNYLVPTLTAEGEQDVGVMSTGAESNIVFAKNQTQISVGTAFVSILSLSLSNFSPTHAQVGLLIIGQASATMTLEGYVSMGGIEVFRFFQSVQTGWATIGIPFVITQIKEGSRYLEVFLKTSTGTFTVDKEKSQMFIVAENMLGGSSAKPPGASIVEEVQMPSIPLSANVTPSVKLDPMIMRNPQEVATLQNLSSFVVDAKPVVELIGG